VALPVLRARRGRLALIAAFHVRSIVANLTKLQALRSAGDDEARAAIAPKIKSENMFVTNYRKDVGLAGLP
jgi:hypothetical protein